MLVLISASLVSSMAKEKTKANEILDTPDVLTTLGLDVSTNRLALVQTRTKFKALKMPTMLKQDSDRPEDIRRIRHAKVSVTKLSKCLVNEESSDCILLAHPCIHTLRQISTSKSGKALGELSCPVLLPSDMSLKQILSIAERTLGAEAYFEWGSGSSTEMLAPLALRSYTAEHYKPWCDCLRARPLAKCLAQEQKNVGYEKEKLFSTDRIVSTTISSPLYETFSYSPQRIQCTENHLNLRSYGRLQQNGANNTHKNIANAHRAYVEAIDATGELHFEVILIDGRAHFSCALKALGYTTNSSVVFANDFPHKYGKRIFRYYNLERTIGPDGEKCTSEKPGRCIAQLRPKSEYVGNHEVHTSFLAMNSKYLRSPVNF